MRSLAMAVWLLGVTGAAAFATPRALQQALVQPIHWNLRSTYVVCQEGAEMNVLQQMSASFWEAKRAQLRAESEARLRELDEFVAREQALTSAALGASAGVPSEPSSAELSQVKLELAQQKAKVEQLEAALAQQALNAELELQKSTAYWIAKVAEVRGQLPAAAAGEDATNLEKKVSSRGPELVPQDLPIVREDMTLRELRAHLLSYGLSTLGLKAELRARLQQAMLDDRQQHKSWDPSTMSWIVPSP